MNITIFGGTGPAGLLTVERALSAGYQVTVYARNPSKINFQHDNLQVVKGELNEPDRIDEAVKGADAVISLLGPRNNARELVIANGTRNIINAMQHNGVHRLITAISSSYRDKKDKFQFGFDFGVWVLKVAGRNILKNIIETGDQVIKSSLQWTLVRLPVLTSKPAKDDLKIGYTGDGNVKFFSLTRTDLADFLIKQIDDKTYLHQCPVVSN